MSATSMKKNGVTVSEHISGVCQHILENVAVYKNDEDGQKALAAFAKEALK